MPPSWERPEVTLAPSPRGEDLELAARCAIRTATTRDPTSWQLVRTGLALSLCSPAAMGNLRFELSLSTGPFARRLRTSRPDEPLPRAIGLPRRHEPPSVVDATAGLCRDAMVLAHLGCHVTGLERVPAFVMLARDAIAHSQLRARLEVIVVEATEWLARLPSTEAPDVVYIDPMFTDEGRAQVKKDMQVCRALAGPPMEPEALFAAARRVAGERIVVKRHPDAPPLAADASFSVAGERVRFDVYLMDRARATDPVSETPTR